MLALITLVAKTILERHLDEGQIRVAIEVRKHRKKIRLVRSARRRRPSSRQWRSCWRCSGRRVLGQDPRAWDHRRADWPDSAQCRSTGEDALAQGASERHVGFVFQHYALFRT